MQDQHARQIDEQTDHGNRQHLKPQNGAGMGTPAAVGTGLGVAGIIAAIATGIVSALTADGASMPAQTSGDLGITSSRCIVRASTSQISALASTEQPCPRHLMIRTTGLRGQPAVAQQPALALGEWALETLQYNRRMALCLRMRSATDRLLATKTLKAAQSGLWQADNSRGHAPRWA
ncbi:MAG: hypothetical protein A2Y76_09490 [Planctomycetes bacterium RBG_13_60_9]|nr:MAG: hypothetical protein A2Y76_09490 [Planctomycetes bacterium RBG_13_60_9]